MKQVEITIQGVKDCLNQGMSREEIATHYGITLADCKELFKDERLKGLKAKKKRGFIIVDDIQPVSDTIIGEELTNIEESSDIENLFDTSETIEDSSPENIVEELKEPNWEN